MCGIAGIMNPGHNALTNIEKMKNSISHRGPDGQGTWIETDGSMVMGHRRLSVIDLSDNGLQPMKSKSERYVMSFNGEIYNYKSIKKDISGQKKYVGFRGSSDSEVLLEAFELWGIKETLKRIMGMFAVALYDRKEKKLYLMRDRIGEKPLYYGIIGGKFYFASDLAAIHAVTGNRLKINKSVLNLYLKHHFIPAPYTIYEDIFKQMPGTLISVSGNTIKYTVEKYYDITEVALQKKSELSFEEASLEFESLLKKVIREQLNADVPVGVFLSGGIDSSLVAAISQCVCNKRINTYTIGFEGSLYDEAQYAEAIAKELGTNHHELYLNNADIFNEIYRVSEIFSEPYANYSAIPSILVCKHARKDITVALGGDGGDEFWAGYEQYADTLYEWNRIRKWSPLQKKIVRNIEGSLIFSSNNRFTRHFRTNRDLPYLDCNSAMDIYKKYTKLDNYESKILLNNYCPEYACSRSEELFGNIIEDIMLMDQQCCLVDDSCVKIDRAGMAVGLEVRSPLLDAEVIDFCWALPCKYKYDHVTKELPRKVLYKYVPKKLIERPKQPFWFPAHEWLKKGELRTWAEDLMNKDIITQEEVFDYDEVKRLWDDYIQRDVWHPEIWSVLMFETWSKRWMS